MGERVLCRWLPTGKAGAACAAAGDQDVFGGWPRGRFVCGASGLRYAIGTAHGWNVDTVASGCRRVV